MVILIYLTYYVSSGIIFIPNVINKTTKGRFRKIVIKIISKVGGFTIF